MDARPGGGEGGGDPDEGMGAAGEAHYILCAVGGGEAQGEVAAREGFLHFGVGAAQGGGELGGVAARAVLHFVRHFHGGEGGERQPCAHDDFGQQEAGAAGQWNGPLLE